MKIIPQSFEYLPDTVNHLMDIADRSHICYQTPTKEDETLFVKNHLIGRQHNSTLEMRVVHIEMDVPLLQEREDLMKNKYLIAEDTEDPHDLNRMYVTGSIRAWREFIKTTSMSVLASDLLYYLRTNINAVLFHDLDEHTEPSPRFMAKFIPATINNAVQYRHEHVAIKIVTNRAITHEIVRHRPVSYLQESQRYCRYDKDGEEGVTFIAPEPFFDRDASYDGFSNYIIWEASCEASEQSYLKLLANGASPQAARTVLPNSCKTEIIVYCSLEQWEHILAMRHSNDAEPSMQLLMEPIFIWFTAEYANIFSPKQSDLKRRCG